MMPNGKQRLFFSCFTVSSTSCRTGFTRFSTLSVRLLKLYSCFPTLSIGFIKSLQIIIFARKNTQPCHTVRRVSDLKSAQHKKSSSAATWIFCMEPICFGIIKGEQPLVCNGDDRGRRPKQGGAVGAAACRMRVPPKARSRRREPQPVLLFSSAARESTVAPQLTISMGDDCVELFVLCLSLIGHAGVRTAPYTSLTTAPISLRMHSARGAISGGSWAGPGLMQT